MIPDDGIAGYARIVNTPDEMVTWTRRHIKRGADWIKIHATGSIPNRGGEVDVWTEAEMRVVCDTAHALGVPVTAHCRSATSTIAAARAGVDGRKVKAAGSGAGRQAPLFTPRRS